MASQAPKVLSKLGVAKLEALGNFADHNSQFIASGIFTLDEG
jgi:hypothetical protein